MDSLMQNVNIITYVAIGGSLLITVVVLFFAFRTFRGVAGMTSNTSQVLMTGEQAQGKVIALNDTGTLVNYNPIVQITVEVTPTTRPAFTASVRQLVPAIKMAQIQPGMTVGVRFDPADMSKVAIELR
jgi:hypothetical protein